MSHNNWCHPPPPTMKITSSSMLWHWWSTIPLSENRELRFVICMHRCMEMAFTASEWKKNRLSTLNNIVQERATHHQGIWLFVIRSNSHQKTRTRLFLFKVSATHSKYRFFFFDSSILFAQWCLVWWPCMRHNVLWLIFSAPHRQQKKR